MKGLSPEAKMMFALGEIKQGVLEKSWYIGENWALCNHWCHVRAGDKNWGVMSRTGIYGEAEAINVMVREWRLDLYL